jgi:hypothetical protein
MQKNVGCMNPRESGGQPESGRGTGGLGEFFHSWRYFIWLLGLVALVALVYAEENWRGQWAWEHYKRGLAEQGDPIERSAIVPPQVPDQDNFAMTPLLAPLFNFVWGGSPGKLPFTDLGLFASNFDNASRELKEMNTGQSNSWVKGRADLPAWHAAFINASNRAANLKARVAAGDFSVPEAAAGVLAQLAEAEPVFAELQAASQRSASRFNLHYDDEDVAEILLPHLSVVKRLSQVLGLRAGAELAAGRTEAAFEDTKLLLHLADACKEEPFLISQLVRMSQFAIALQPLTEGMSQWPEPQLRFLQGRLARFDFCADTKRAFRSERVAGALMIEMVRSSPSRVSMLGLYGGGRSGFEFEKTLISIAPKGWLDLERLNYCRLMEKHVLSTIDLSARRISPRGDRAGDRLKAELDQRSLAGLYLRHRLFSSVLIPSISRTPQKAAFFQTAVDCAVIACALERYRRAYGSLPETLAALEPEFIAQVPRDIVSGEPLKYHRTGPDRYVLYSVGWNMKDDQGVIAPAKKGDESARSEGDWVWRLL